MTNDEDKEICRKCGGVCCKSVAGANMPEDFDCDIDKVKKALATGRYTIDCWEGDPRDKEDIPRGEVLRHSRFTQAHFIRPSGKGLEGKIPDYTWGGIGCTFLGTDGCSLDINDRPSGCRLLEPKPKGQNCIPHGAGKREAAVAWIPYNLKQLIQ